MSGEPTDRFEIAASHTFFNVDVECTATTPSMGYLLTVGIVPVVHDGERWTMHSSRLYVRLDQGDEFPEPEHYTSMPWWREQSDEAQDEAYRNRSLVRHSPDLAAAMIAEYVAEVQPDWSQRFFTANPVSFDKPWLDDLFASAGIPSPFHYRSLCLRSMRFGMDSSRGFGSTRESHDPVIPHHALHDAEAQALDLIDMLGGAQTDRFEITPLAKALQSAGNCLASHPRDWAVDRRDAWLWGIVCGWPPEAMDECAAKFGWSDSDVANLRSMREAVRLITGEDDDE